MELYFPQFEERVGKTVADYILQQMSEGKITLSEAKDCATHLNPDVGGKFVRAQGEVKFVFDQR